MHFKKECIDFYQGRRTWTVNKVSKLSKHRDDPTSSTVTVGLSMNTFAY